VDEEENTIQNESFINKMHLAQYEAYSAKRTQSLFSKNGGSHQMFHQ